MAILTTKIRTIWLFDLKRHEAHQRQQHQNDDQHYDLVRRIQSYRGEPEIITSDPV
jgi:hypothetical protein